MLDCPRYAPSAVRFSAPSFCPAASPSALLAVLGIFSVEPNSLQRLEIRSSWWAGGRERGLLSRFVLFGQQLTGESILNESLAHGDIVFLRGAAGRSCRQEPLLKLLAWLKCAVSAWPQASLIGKGDDDAWIHLDGVARHLAASLAHSAEGNGLYWGQMETFSWNISTHRPLGWGTRFGRRRSNCTEQHAVMGPFAFAKGPCYFLSIGLASALLASEAARKEAVVALRAQSSLQTWAWEDVFVGLALAALVAVNVAGTVVHVGGEVFSENFGRFAMKNSTLVWHDKRQSAVSSRHESRLPERMSAAQEWAERHHCVPSISSFACDSWLGCSGAAWRRCVTTYDRASLCSNTLVDVADPPLRSLSNLRAHGVDTSRLPTAMTLDCSRHSRLPPSGGGRKTLSCVPTILHRAEV